MILDAETYINVAVNLLQDAADDERIRTFMSALETAATGKLNPSAGDFDAPNAKNVMAAGLAMMLHCWNDCLPSGEISIRAQAMLDSCLSQIYKRKNIDKGDQTFEKRRVIIDVVEELLADLKRMGQAQPTVQMFSQFRERYLRVYNSEPAKLLLHPLLPDGLRGVLALNSVFKAIESFVGETGGEKRQAAIAAMEAINSLESLLTRIPLILQEAVAAPLIAMFSTVRESWAIDPANLQANLSLDPLVRRYPLSEGDRAIEIGVSLTNHGPGVAWDIEVKYVTDLAFEEGATYLGTAEPGVLQVDLHEVIKEPVSDEAQVSCTISWVDSSGPQRREQNFKIGCQRSDTDWDRLRRSSPYSTEPVFKSNQFFGRKDKIDSFIGKLAQEQMPSFYVVGQKRVGKTSFVQRIEEIVRSTPELHAETIFVSPEYFIAATGVETVARLSQYIADQIRERFPSLRLPGVKAREVQDLNVLFESIGAAGKRIIIAIDEFDEIPSELFDERSDLSGPFFLALRGSSSQPHVSFIIVGSEKLDLIMMEQGQRLNKWLPEKLDYFSKETSWNDYRELVVKPVEHQIDFGDEAISLLYDLTAGHPYFTKQICQRVIENACRDRISWVGRQNIEAAYDQLVEELDSGPFQHFWKDGLVGTQDQQDQGRYLRQCLLLAMSDIARRQSQLSRKVVLEHASVVDVADSASEQLSQFFQRKILKGTLDLFEFRVRFFERWLQNKGVEQVASGMRDPSGIIQQLRDRADRAVKSDELAAVSEHWVYKGHRVSTDEIRRWLEQFGTVDEQRLAFPVLKHLKFVTAEAYMPTFRAYSTDIQRRLPALLAAKAKKRGDMLVSYLGSPGKSGTELARRFADAARILTDCIVERGKLSGILQSREETVQALIFVDDFIGSGKSACSGIEELASECGDALKERGTFVYYLCVVATAAGRDRLLELGRQKFGDKFEVRAVTLIGDEARLFSDRSETYPDPEERRRARELFAKFGLTLEPSHPLGYEDGQLAVVFETTCPNNTLPVLWKDRGKWSSLFSRHGA